MSIYNMHKYAHVNIYIYTYRHIQQRQQQQGQEVDVEWLLPQTCKDIHTYILICRMHAQI